MSEADIADVGADHVGYETLLIAIVTQAVDDYLDGPGDPVPSAANRWAKAKADLRRQRYEETQHYIFDDTKESRENIFGFAFILTSLGIDPESARKSILRRTRCNGAKKEGHALDPMYASPENNRHGTSA